MKHKNSILDQFEKKAGTFSDCDAINQASFSYTFRDIDRISNNIALLLQHKGIQPGSVIAIFGDQSPEYVVTMLGILKHGSIFLPVGTRFPPERIISIMAIARPAGIIAANCTIQDFSKQSDDTVQSVPVMKVELRGSNEQMGWIYDGKPSNQPSIIDQPDACYVIPTSGSTGTPKLILGSVKGLHHFIDWELRTFGIKENSRISALSAPTFDVSLRDMFVAFLSGSTLCIPDRETVLSPQSLAEWFYKQKINITHIVPSVLRLLMRGLELNAENYALPDLAILFSAGEPLYGEDVNRWRSCAGNRSTLVNLYGPSETTLAKLFHVVGNATEYSRPMIPLGKPIDNTEVIIFDDNRICSVEETGEICIRTQFRSYGYFSDEKLTAARFVRNPLGDDEQDVIFRSGDSGYCDDEGRVHFTGRLDGQVKIDGNRVETGEIEACLRLHPAINEAAIVSFGVPVQRLVAHVVYKHNQTASIEELRSFLAARLPVYMIPTVFQFLDALPRTHSGKIDRHALPVPLRERPVLRADFIRPSSQIEIILADIWKDMLQIETVGIQDNFFDLGGTSLLAGHCLVEINEKLNTHFTVTAILQYPTVAQLAHLIEVGEDRETDASIAERAFKRRSAGANRRRISEESGDSA